MQQKAGKTRKRFAPLFQTPCAGCFTTGTLFTRRSPVRARFCFVGLGRLVASAIAGSAAPCKEEDCLVAAAFLAGSPRTDASFVCASFKRPRSLGQKTTVFQPIDRGLLIFCWARAPGRPVVSCGVILRPGRLPRGRTLLTGEEYGDR